jgi:uncharacterized protein YbaP (TraB family)
MKKTITLSVAMALSIGISFAQSSVWEISKNGNTLYLGGSVHILRAEDYPLPQEFDMAFDKSDILVLEADVAQMQNPEVAQKMMAQSMLPSDETLQTVLDAETYKLLADKSAELSFPLDNMQKMKPAMVVTFLTMGKMQQLGFTPQGVDTHYETKARENNMKIDFLETIDFQIDLFTNMGTGYENEFVKYSLEELDNVEKQINLLIPEWRNGSSTLLETVINPELKEKFPTVYQTINIDRNNDWLPILETYLQDERVEFVVVGLAHLHGEDGLLALLRNKGYVVKQVK